MTPCEPALNELTCLYSVMSEQKQQQQQGKLRAFKAAWLTTLHQCVIKSVALSVVEIRSFSCESFLYTTQRAEHDCVLVREQEKD